MSRGTRRLLYGAVAILLGATASLALAGGEPPQATYGWHWGGDDWRDWWSPGAGMGTLATCDLTSEQPGEEGWFRGPVTVDCSALLTAPGAERVAFSVGFGDWQESDGSLTLESEGSHWIQVQTRTGDGVAGLPESLSVAIDATAPTVWLQAPRNRVLSHADTLRLDFGADDQTSGVDLVVAELNGEQEIAAGAAVELWQLPLGTHQLSVRARDRAGNEAFLDEPVALTIAVDLPGMTSLVQRLGVRGKIDHAFRQQLNGHLAAAVAAQGEGDTFTARFELQLFLDAVMDGMAQRQIFADAGEVLVSDAYYLIDSLEDDPATGPPDWAGR